MTPIDKTTIKAGEIYWTYKGNTESESYHDSYKHGMCMQTPVKVTIEPGLQYAGVTGTEYKAFPGEYKYRVMLSDAPLFATREECLTAYLVEKREALMQDIATAVEELERLARYQVTEEDSP